LPSGAGPAAAPGVPSAAPGPTPAPPSSSAETAKSQEAGTGPGQSCQANPQGPACQYERALTQLAQTGLPIGWSTETLLLAPWVSLIDSLSATWALLQAHFVGWLITALAVWVGARFWFDLLNKIVTIRAATKPPAPPPTSTPVTS